MSSPRCIFVLAVIAFLSAAPRAEAGSTYRVSSNNGKETITYEVDFGGGKAFEKWTAFDPASKSFVCLDWKRGTPTPQAAATIWDHRTGETISLYKFPQVEQPLPLPPSCRLCRALVGYDSGQWGAVPGEVSNPSSQREKERRAGPLAEAPPMAAENSTGRISPAGARQALLL